MSPSNQTRILMSRRHTKAFMDRDPLSISLTRKTRVDSGAGGWVHSNPVTLDPQEFRMTPFKRRLGPGESASPDGDVANTQFLLMGTVDADIEKGDEFSVGDDNFLVLRVHFKRQVRTIAVVEWQGKAS